jgi:plasmid stability protein
MATLTIRNLDEDLKMLLRVEAASNGRSMEEEVRVILRNALSKPRPSGGLGSRMRARFAESATELELPSRTVEPRATDFDE